MGFDEVRNSGSISVTLLTIAGNSFPIGTTVSGDVGKVLSVSAAGHLHIQLDSEVLYFQLELRL